MERVVGIGGFVFQAREPETLARWYADHLGIQRSDTDDSRPVWWQPHGPALRGRSARESSADEVDEAFPASDSPAWSGQPHPADDERPG